MGWIYSFWYIFTIDKRFQNRITMRRTVEINLQTLKPQKHAFKEAEENESASVYSRR